MAATPFAADALGLGVDVRTSLELIDHVVPGASVTVPAVLALALAARYPSRRMAVEIALAAVSTLAGVWVFATHVPLLIDAADGSVTWSSALIHSALGLPLAALGIWLLVCATAPTPGERGPA